MGRSTENEMRTMTDGQTVRGEWEWKRTLFEGYAAIKNNAFWQWLFDDMNDRREYLRQRLLHAENWGDYRALAGRLEMVELWLAQVDSVCEGSLSKGGEDDEL